MLFYAVMLTSFRRRVFFSSAWIHNRPMRKFYAILAGSAYLLLAIIMREEFFEMKAVNIGFLGVITLTVYEAWFASDEQMLNSEENRKKLLYILGAVALIALMLGKLFNWPGFNK